MTRREKYPHYYKKSPTLYIDVYRILDLYEVSDPCIQHAIKKLLAAGKRGAKDSGKDVTEAIVSLERWHEMREEELRAAEEKKYSNLTVKSDYNYSVEPYKSMIDDVEAGKCVKWDN